MNRFILWSLAVTVLPYLIGCSESTPDATDGSIPVRDAAVSSDAGGRIGTIDLGRIYFTLGLQQQRVARSRELNAEIGEFSESAREQVSKKLAEFGGDPQALEDEQRKEMQSLDAELTKELRKRRAEAQQIMTETDQFLQRILKQKTSVPIQKVADKRNLDIVLIHRPDSFAYLRPSVDITDEVLKEIGVDPTSPPNGPALQPPAADPGNDSGTDNDGSADAGATGADSTPAKKSESPPAPASDSSGDSADGASPAASDAVSEDGDASDVDPTTDSEGR